MAVVFRRDIAWIVTEEAHAELADVREALGTGYKADVSALQDLLSDYFSGDEGARRVSGRRSLHSVSRLQEESSSRSAG